MLINAKYRVWISTLTVLLFFFWGIGLYFEMKNDRTLNYSKTWHVCQSKQKETNNDNNKIKGIFNTSFFPSSLLFSSFLFFLLQRGPN